MWAHMGPCGRIWVAKGGQPNVNNVKILISDGDFFLGLCHGDRDRISLGHNNMKQQPWNNGNRSLNTSKNVINKCIICFDLFAIEIVDRKNSSTTMLERPGAPLESCANKCCRQHP